jgi:hypothetical protein
MAFPDSGSGFFSNPDPGVKKAPDPGSARLKRYQYQKSKPVLSPKKQFIRNFLKSEKALYLAF